MTSRFTSDLRKLWYGAFIARDKATGRFTSLKYKGERVITRIPVAMQFRVPTGINESEIVSIPSEVRVSLVMVGSSDVLKSLYFIAGRDINYNDMFEHNLSVAFRLLKAKALNVIRTGEGMMANTGRYADRKAGLVMDRDGRPVLPWKQSWNARYKEYVDPEAGRHPLGRLSGELYSGVANTKMGGLETRETGGDQFLNRFYGKKQNKFLGSLQNVDIEALEDVYGDTRERFIAPRDFSVVTNFNNPEYIGYVHDGKENTTGRPFFTYANLAVASAINQHYAKLGAMASLDKFHSVTSLMILNETIMPEYMDEDVFLSELKKRPQLRKLRGLIEAGSMLNPSSEDYMRVFGKRR